MVECCPCSSCQLIEKGDFAFKFFSKHFSQPTVPSLIRFCVYLCVATVDFVLQGSIEFGKDADFVIWDPEASFKVDESFKLFHKHNVKLLSSVGCQ